MKDTMTNFEFAKRFEEDIKNEILNATHSQIEFQFVNEVFSKFLSITPRQDENRIIKIRIPTALDNINGISTKISNVQLNLRETIIFASEFALGFGSPSNAIELILLALTATLKLYTLSTIRLNRNECSLLLYLHQNGAYEVPVLESEILDSIRKNELDLQESDYYSTIKNLIRISSIVIVDGRIILKEIVKLNY